MNQIDYSDIGYDDFLRRGYTPNPDITEDEAQIKTPQIPTSNVKGEIPKEQIEKAVNDISRLSQVTTASALGVGNNSTALLTSTIEDMIYPDKVVLAIAEVTAYDGTIGSEAAIIYPTSNYRIDQGYSYHWNAVRSNNGKALTYYQAITNQSGVSKNIYWIIRWRFIGTNTAGA